MPQKVENREEKYIPGAWENFVRRRVKKRRIVFMKYATSLAACLVVGWLAFRFVFPSANYPETISRPEERSAISKVPILPHREIASSQTQPKIEKEKGEPTDEMKKLTASSHFPKKQEDTVPGTQKPGSEEEKNFTSPEIQRDIAEKAPQKKTEKKKVKPEKQATQNRIDEVLSKDDLTHPKKAPRNSPFSGKVRFGILFSPGVNSTATNSAFAFSGGISADFRLSHAFFLSTGIQVERQNVNRAYPNNEFMGIDNQTTADLFCLDIPLNITWKFLTDKSTAYYVSGGISSLAYLNENYKNKSTIQELVEVVKEENGQETVDYKLVTKETVTSESAQAFQSFDLGGRLNLMVGLEQKITSRMHLHVEPYIKIPLSGLGAQDLKFTTSGIRCKVSF
ncbi:MAG: porin family protein [Mariniphaga sp.]